MKQEQTTSLASTNDLTPEENEAVALLLASGGQLDEAIPDEIDGPTLWFNLQACCKALSVHRRNISTLKPLIGRMLIILQDNPSILKHYGYQTFDGFVSKGLRDLLGMPRSEAYAATRLVKKFPSLSVEECAAVTYSKLSFISKFTDETQPDANKWLTLAQNNSLDVLKDIAANKGIISREDSDFVTYSVVMTRGQRDILDAFLTDPSIQASVGTDNPGIILEMMVADCEAGWRVRNMYKEAQ